MTFGYGLDWTGLDQTKPNFFLLFLPFFTFFPQLALPPPAISNQFALPAPATYNQFNIPPPQQLSHQTAYQIHGESNGAFQHGSSLQSNIPLNANVETQSEVESDEGEPDILELLKDTTINFLDIQFIKNEFGATLRRFKKFGNRKKMEKFIRTYANLKVRVMDEYDELDKGVKDEADDSVDIDSDGEGSEDMDVQGSDDGSGDIDDEGSESESEGGDSV